MPLKTFFEFLVIRFPSTDPLPRTEILTMLAGYDWTFSSGGTLRYFAAKTAPTDINTLAWVEEIGNFEALLKKLQKDENDIPLIGLATSFGNSNVGGHILLWSAEEAKKRNILSPVIFMPTEPFKKKSVGQNCEITDVDWYFDTLIPALCRKEHQTSVEAFAYKEFKTSL